METLNEPKVSVVILNWNGENLLKKYFYSLVNQDFNKFEIIFVDNNSKDKSIDAIKEINNNKINLKIVNNDKNYGTAEASNIGAKYCCGKYIFFVSNDMIFSKDLITNLNTFMEKDPKVGIATVKMLKIIDDQKSDTIDSCGGNVDFLCTAQINNINKNLQSIKDHNKEIFFSFGGALFIRRKLFEKINGYDERYFTLTDDIDLCWRAKLFGYKIFYIKESYLYHRVSATLSETHNRATKRFFSERNNLCSCLKNYSLISLLFIFPIYLIISFMEIIFFLIIFKPSMSFAVIKSILWNIINFKETLKKRKYIQKKRLIKDSIVLNEMIKYPVKFCYFYSFLFKRKEWKNYF